MRVREIKSCVYNYKVSGTGSGGEVAVVCGDGEGMCESSSEFDFPRTLRRREHFRGGRDCSRALARAHKLTTHTHDHRIRAIVFDRRRRLRSHAKTTPPTFSPRVCVRARYVYSEYNNVRKHQTLSRPIPTTAARVAVIVGHPTRCVHNVRICVYG